MAKGVKREIPEIRYEYWFKCDYCDQEFKHQSDCTKHEQKDHLIEAFVKDPESGLTLYKFRNAEEFSAFVKRSPYHTQGEWEGADNWYTVYEYPTASYDEDTEYKLITAAKYAGIIEEEIKEKEQSVFSLSKHLEDLRDCMGTLYGK